MKILQILVLGIGLIFSLRPNINAQIYVNQNSTGLNDGSSWANAYTELYSALNDPALGITKFDIWITAGVYKPNPSNGRGSSFHVFRNNVNIYGGFTGTETMLEQRDLKFNETILSGDLGVVGDNTDNSYHTIFIDNVDAFLLDGVHVMDGNADGTDWESKGGGILIISNFEVFEISIWSTFFENNSANYGGAIAQINNANGFASAPNSTLNIANSVFAENIATTAGAAILIENATTGTDGDITSELKINHLTFSNNQSSTQAGAIFALNSDVTANDLILIDAKNSIFNNNLPETFSSTGLVNFSANYTIFSDTPANVTFSNSRAGIDPNLNSDHTLTLFSQALNNGIEDASTPVKDILGEQRIRNGIPDIGAFELKQTASVLINEFTANDPASCDKVELRAIRAGTMEGISLVERTTSVLTFPDFEVQKNDLIVIHFNNTACNTGSSNEMISKDEFPSSTYPSNYYQAFDWYVTDGGLSTADIVLYLTDAQSQIIDAVLGTDNDGMTIAPNNTVADQVSAAGQWEMVGGGVPSGGFTGVDFEIHAVSDLDLTGSMQRLSDGDTNTRGDWGENISETFGLLNSLQSINYDNPPVIIDDNFIIFENLTSGNKVGQVKAFDPDPGDEIFFTITSGDPANLFEINPFGVIFLNAGKAVDFETESVHNLLITAWDAFQPSQANITITINDVNEAPVFTGGLNLSILEDAGDQLFPAWATNIFDGDNSTQNITFEFDIPDPTFFDIQPVINSSTGDLIFRAAPDKNGTFQIGVRLTDDGGTANGGMNQSAYQYFTLEVIPVNDVPEFTIPATVNVLEDAGAIVVSGFATSISDGDEGTQVLNFNVLPVNNSPFSEPPAIDPLTGDLSFTTVANENGTVQLEVSLQDNGGIQNSGIDVSAVQIFTLNIEPVNDPPVFLNGGDIFVTTNSPTQTIADFITNLDDGDPEILQTLQFSITPANPALFIIQPSIQNLSDLIFTPQAGIEGSTILTIRLTDNGNTLNGGINYQEQQFSITVGNLNLPPSFTKGGDIEINEDAGFQTIPSWATDINDGNGGTQNLNFIVSSNNAALFSVPPAVTSSGDLLFEVKQNRSGAATVKVILKDDGGTANGGIDGSLEQEFQIKVNSVNDEPTFAYPNFLQLIEDFEALVYSPIPDPPPADESSQIVTYSISPDPASVQFINVQFDPSSGRIEINPAPDQSGAITFTITANDGQPINNTFDQQLIIQVVPENDSPEIVNVDSMVEVSQNSVTSYQIGADAFIDKEDGTDLSISVSLAGNNPLPDWIAYDEITKTLVFSPTDLIIGTFPINVSASDKEGRSISTILDVVVLVVTGFDNDLLNNDLVVFPNPVADNLNISGRTNYDSNFTVNLISTSGKIVKSWNQQLSRGEFIIHYEISDLLQGIYLLEMKSKTETLYTKFIRN